MLVVVTNFHKLENLKSYRFFREDKTNRRTYIYDRLFGYNETCMQKKKKGKMMKLTEYLELKIKLINLGYADEIDWAGSLQPCENYDIFATEAIWVIISSGMKNQIAKIIEQRIYHAIYHSQPLNSAFGHEGKVKAIEYILNNKTRLFYEYENAEDKIEYLKSLPYIGNITKYHLAKNLGLDVCKPDRHLVRIAKKYNQTPVELCQKLADLTGDRIGVVDIVLWRAGNLGII